MAKIVLEKIVKELKLVQIGTFIYVLAVMMTVQWSHDDYYRPLF